MKVVEKIKALVFYSIIVFPENRVVYEIMSKNVAEPERPLITVEYGACALHVG